VEDRLVGDDDVGLECDGAGDADPLPLAAPLNERQPRWPPLAPLALSARCVNLRTPNSRTPNAS
jgi:hypothetical protein